MNVSGSHRSTGLTLEKIAASIQGVGALLYSGKSIEHLTQEVFDRLSTSLDRSEERRSSLDYCKIKDITDSVVILMSVWKSAFGFSSQEVAENLTHLKGWVSPVGQSCKEIDIIRSIESAYVKNSTLLAKDAAQLFWKGVRALVDGGYATDEACWAILIEAFPNADISSIRPLNASLIYNHYHDLAVMFARLGRWELVEIMWLQDAAETSHSGALSADLVFIALKQNDLSRARDFQERAEIVNPDADESPLEVLLDEKSASNIDVLAPAFKKAVDLHELDLAFEFAERIFGLEKTIRSGTSWALYKHFESVISEINSYLLKKGEYKLLEKVVRRWVLLDWPFWRRQIILDKLKKNDVDNRLINAALSEQSLDRPLMRNVVSVLHTQKAPLDNIRQLVIAQLKKLTEEDQQKESYIRGLEKQILIRELAEILSWTEPEIRAWLRKTPAYREFYSSDDALDEKNTIFLMGEGCIDEKALGVYEQELMTAGVLDFLIQKAGEGDLGEVVAISIIRVIGQALDNPSLCGRAKRFLLEFSTHPRERSGYHARVEALQILFRRSEKDLELLDTLNQIIQKDPDEIMQRKALNLRDGLSDEAVQKSLHLALGKEMLSSSFSELDTREMQQNFLYLLSDYIEWVEGCPQLVEAKLPGLLKSIDQVLSEGTRFPQGGGGYTPLSGPVDTSWSQLSELLLILGFIGQRTNSKTVYEGVKAKIVISGISGGRVIKSVVADALRMLDRNKKFNISGQGQLSDDCSKSTSSEIQHSFHEHGSEWHFINEAEHQALWTIVHSTDMPPIERLLALRDLCNPILSRPWGTGWYQKQEAQQRFEAMKSEGVPDCLKEEVGRIDFWLAKDAK